jgi:hypothetical protein
MAQLISLSDQDLARLRGELATGRPPTVWFTPAAVGVDAGRSAKVVGFADTAEGDYVQVRPTGSKDVLSFSPSELTITRPPRRKATQKAARPTARAAARPAPPAAAPKVAAAPRPAATPKPVPAATPATEAEAAPVQPAPRRPARARPGAGSSRSAEVTVTLSSSAAGDWTVEVVVGKRRTVRAIPISPADVAKAAKALPAAVGEAIDAALVSARAQQQARVEQLQAELEAAQRTLKDLS